MERFNKTSHHVATLNDSETRKNNKKKSMNMNLSVITNTNVIYTPFFKKI